MSQRGAITLFSDIFSEPAKPISGSQSLRQKKIECIIDFYYFTGKKTGLKYEGLMEKCSEAFFLSTFTLHDIMQGNLDKLLVLKKLWKDESIDKLQKHLAKKWPHLIWD